MLTYTNELESFDFWGPNHNGDVFFNISMDVDSLKGYMVTILVRFFSNLCCLLSVNNYICISNDQLKLEYQS